MSEIEVKHVARRLSDLLGEVHGELIAAREKDPGWGPSHELLRRVETARHTLVDDVVMLECAVHRAARAEFADGDGESREARARLRDALRDCLVVGADCA